MPYVIQVLTYSFSFGFKDLASCPCCARINIPALSKANFWLWILVKGDGIPPATWGLPMGVVTSMSLGTDRGEGDGPE